MREPNVLEERFHGGSNFQFILVRCFLVKQLDILFIFSSYVVFVLVFIFRIVVISASARVSVFLFGFLLLFFLLPFLLLLVLCLQKISESITHGVAYLLPNPLQAVFLPNPSPTGISGTRYLKLTDR